MNRVWWQMLRSARSASSAKDADIAQLHGVVAGLESENAQLRERLEAALDGEGNERRARTELEASREMTAARLVDELERLAKTEVTGLAGGISFILFRI